MRKAIYIIAVVLLLGGCAGSSEKEVKPKATTNQITLANVKLAIAYMERGDYQTAVDKLDRAIKADPDYYDSYNVYGVLYQDLKKPRLAEQAFKKALQLNPNDSPTMNNYGRFLCESKRLDEAEAMFKKSAANPLYDTPEIPLTNAGTCDLLNGRRAQAEKEFRHALQLNPRVPEALLQMAHISYHDKQFLSARGYMQRYLAIARPTPNSLWLDIRIEKELGDKNTVSSDALLLRNTFPDSDEAQLLKESGIR